MRQSSLNQKIRSCAPSLLFFASSRLLVPQLHALDNGLARTPPMGWNTWNKFACNVSEKLVKEAADAIVSSGMKDAGYKYVVSMIAGRSRGIRPETLFPMPSDFRVASRRWRTMSIQRACFLVSIPTQVLELVRTVRAVVGTSFRMLVNMPPGALTILSTI